MKLRLGRTYPATLIGIFIAVLLSCSQPAKQTGGGQAAPTPAAPAAPQPTTRQAGVEQRQIPAVQQPTVQTATITFLTGDVQISHSSTWTPANIGDSIAAPQRLRVGAGSYCEVQFGNLAVARIEPNTVVAIATLELGQARKVGLALTTGAVVSKVQKLAGDDQYQVSTRTAVAGVRGTEFRVATTGPQQTELAVKEGVVTVVPPEAAISVSSPAQQAVAREVERTITANAPTVTANEQLVVTSEDFAPVRRQLAAVKQQIEAGATAQAVAPLVSATTTTATTSVPKPQPISARQQAALAVTTQMQLLPTAPQPSTAAAQPAPVRTVPLSVTVQPAQAQIYLDGRLVGAGGFSGLYLPGRTINVSVRLAGYETKTVPVTMSASGTALSIQLTRSSSPQPPSGSNPPAQGSAPSAAAQPQQSVSAPPSGAGTQTASAAARPAPARQTAAARPNQGQPAPTPAAAAQPVRLAVTITAVPNTARISIDGKEVGVGSYRARLRQGRRIQVEVQASGYDAQSRSVTVSRSNAALAFRLKRQIQYGTLEITTDPANAALYVNGNYAGTDTYTAKLTENSSVTVRASLRGYREANATYTVKANTTTRRTLSLRPQPIEGRFSVATTALVRSLALSGQDLISVDKQGTLRSTSRSGKTNWKVTTSDRPNDNARPVAAGGTVYFSGAGEFVAIDASAGTPLFRIKLGQADAHLFGRSVTVANGAVLYPTDNAIVVYDGRSGQVQRKIPLPSTSNMSVLESKGKLFVADLQGTLYELDAQSGAVVEKIPTSAVQPVALSAQMQGSRVFFAGRRGTAVLADAASAKVLWQRRLDTSRSVAVFTDPVLSGSGIYLYGNNTLFGLSLADGTNLFKPITKVSSPPLVVGGALFYGTTDGRLVKANASTGAIEAAVDVGSPISTRPIDFAGDIAVGTESGEIVLVYPKTMPASR